MIQKDFFIISDLVALIFAEEKNSSQRKLRHFFYPDTHRIKFPDTYHPCNQKGSCQLPIELNMITCIDTK